MAANGQVLVPVLVWGLGANEADSTGSLVRPPDDNEALCTAPLEANELGTDGLRLGDGGGSEGVT